MRSTPHHVASLNTRTPSQERKKNRSVLLAPDARGSGRRRDWGWSCCRTFQGFVLAVVLLSGLASGHAAGSAVRPEYDVKAAFLQKFALFVEWPASAFSSPKEPITIGILGQDPFGRRLETILSNKLAQGRSLEFRRYTKVEDVIKTRCHLLFISPCEKSRLAPVLEVLRTAPILTVGDTPDFGELGVMINLVVVGESLRFEINQETSNRAGLKISSQLLDLAVRVRRGSKQTGAK